MDNPIAKINLNNIKHNIVQIKKTAKNSNIVAVIKANAYGHGAFEVARFLDNDDNVNAFGISRFSEAQELYNKGITKPLLLMEGVRNKQQLIEASKHDCWFVVHSDYQIDLIKSVDYKKPINIWIKFNTGMNRLGFNTNVADDVLMEISKLIGIGKVSSELTIMTHFSCADDSNNFETNNQITKLNNIISDIRLNNNNFNLKISAANSAGVFAWTDSHYDWVRPGISMYGSSPLLDKSYHDLNLKPAVEVSASVIALNKLEAGDKIGYGHAWQAVKETFVAIITCGYADCYPWRQSYTSQVYVHNTRCNILGRISMDMLAIDVTAIVDQLQIGDKVELWGENIHVDEVAKACNTISYTLMTRISKRVEKVYVE